MTRAFLKKLAGIKDVFHTATAPVPVIVSRRDSLAIASFISRVSVRRDDGVSRVKNERSNETMQDRSRQSLVAIVEPEAMDQG